MSFLINLASVGPEAFAEDHWEYVKIGDVVTKVCLECLRCIETTVSENGEMNKEREPLKTLEKYHPIRVLCKSPKKLVFFLGIGSLRGRLNTAEWAFI